MASEVREVTTTKPASATVFGILVTLSASHMLNDLIQALLPSIYPLLSENYHLNLGKIGNITCTYQVVASILQPLVGRYSDRYPKPYSLALGMGLSLIGLIGLSQATTYFFLLVSAATVGLGSAIFHPEASRVAHMAAGGRHGFAQSLFQVGGNVGSALGPLMAAVVVIPYGQHSISCFGILALVGIYLLIRVGAWYSAHLKERKAKVSKPAPPRRNLSRSTVIVSLVILMVLVFSKYVYLASLTNYYTFYLIDSFHVSKQAADFYLFFFLAAVAAGTILGGLLGDKFGRKYVIWFSILGVAPFTIALPYMGLLWTILLSIVIGAILASAFSAILVYAQELVPGNVGMIAGVFFGLAFGIGGIASASLGRWADRTSIEHIFRVCGYLPLLGLLTAFLPDLSRKDT